MVTELKKQYTFDVEVVKKTDTVLIKRLFGLKFPSVEIDGTMIAELRDVTREELETALQQCC
ncbi:MAG: NEPxGxxU family selenoprotein [Thermodesulfovibrionales bacterium]